MSKKFRRWKKFLRIIGFRGKLTFGDYKKSIHTNNKMDKKKRKEFLKEKWLLSQGRESVVVGNAIYYWGKDKKSIFALVPDFDGIRKACSMLKESDETQGERNE